MSRPVVAVVADVHIGNHRRFGGEEVAGINARCRMVLDVLGRAVDMAHERGAQAFVVAGDLFDVANPTPQVVAATGTILARHPAMVKYLLVGNHDMVSDAPGDHALGPLGLIPGVKVVEFPTMETIGGVDLIMVPFAKGDVAVHLDKHVGFNGGSVASRVLVFHAGIADSMTKRFLVGAADSIEIGKLTAVMDKYRIGRALAGNWHDRRMWVGSSVLQCGALVPTGFDNPGVLDYGTVALVQDDMATNAITVDMVPGPRFLNLTPGARGLEQLVLAKERQCTAFAQVRGSGWESHAAGAWMNEAIARGDLAGGTTKLEDDIAEGQARMAAHAATHAGSLSEALANYCATADLGKYTNGTEVDRPAVMHQALEYLK